MAHAVGVGGSVEIRLVPAQLLLMDDHGELIQLEAEIEMAKPHPDLNLFPPLLGRDVTDLFRTSSTEIVALTDSHPNL